MFNNSPLTREQQRRQRNHLQGLALLRQIFRAEYAQFFLESSKYRHEHTKATKKGHIHKHRPAGSKMLKRYNRQQWNAFKAAIEAGVWS